ncbi:serine--tRNA ligase [Chitinophaga oryzae]|uniref:Serine--tRNA ligase n=1 Tax=Chitinophaga oryzae TaxID=2725414 RepID=A0AAE6ZLV5_9BACT|nr:serine--tRNA ligase [Chitinophaga oryzae]QJB34962.1 serine--tRNA ligase [Chitinophaga oryzae]QJB41473.1 serine--tRNA ligase [Chitinophaga oryzae]
MLQVPFIRQNKELVLERLALKNFKELGLVDEVLALDDKRKRLTQEYDETQAQVNSLSKEIGKLMAQGKKEEGEQQRAAVNALKEKLGPVNEELNATEKALHDTLVKLPNLPAAIVPPGHTPEENVEVRRGGNIPTLAADAVPHWDLAKKYQLIDFELGNKITGSGFPVFQKQGARLQRAMIQYFLDFNLDNGYTEYAPPYLVNETSAFGTGQLPDKEGQMYHATEDNYFLIPTAEVPLTNIYRDEIVKDTDLPIRMTGYTPCFRREAGSYGKDVRGLNRVHQFDKVELVQIVHPEKSYEALDEMVAHVEKLLNSLQLPYRILRLCGGDMSFASAITYDFEVYSAAQQKWLEVSSVSNFETYQTNRMKIRFKEANGKPQLTHSLNGSSLALPRIMACVLENNQTEAGIQLPAVLHRYFGADKIA